MAQYCRYCTHLHVNNEPYCEEKAKFLSVSTCKTSNKCKRFCLAECEEEYQDAFFENTKGYKPREPKQKQCDGQMELLGGGE